MEIIENLFERIVSIFMQVWAVIAESPFLFGGLLVIVFGAAIIAERMDEAGRKVDSLIEEALEEKE